MTKIEQLLSEVRSCTLCSEHLPHGPRPVLQIGGGARILIAGQAPGRKVHESGIPFDDASGARLRDWLGITPATFYDPGVVALVGMGFCYPRAGLAPARAVASAEHRTDAGDRRLRAGLPPPGTPRHAH